MDALTDAGEPGDVTYPGDYVDGRFVRPAAPDGELRCNSPADLDRTVARHDFAVSHVGAAVAAARAAADGFRRRPRAEREALLRAYQTRLRAHRDAIAATIAHEVGKPLWEARAEADALAAKVDVSLGAGAEFTRTQAVDALPGEIAHRPLGVIAVIGPFNFPGHLPNGQIVPALLEGNTVVHKPSERAPSTGYWIARCMDEAGMPAGVFNLVQGPGEVSGALCDHDDLDGIFFTGSTATGRAIARQNAHRIDRVVALELGGKNAALVLEDCDLRAAARALAFSAYATAGQRCTSTSRVIARREVADALATELRRLGETLRVGHPFDDDVFMGPVIDGDAVSRVGAAQRLAVDAGFEPLLPGGPAQVHGRRGHYLRPGLHRAPTPAGPFPEAYADDELFAPDIALYAVADDDAALELANATRFGLIAGIYTASEARFRALAAELRVGVVHWNRATAGASGRLPFGGVGDSGNHRPAGVLAGATSTHPVSLLLPPRDPPVAPNWPGFAAPDST